MVRRASQLQRAVSLGTCLVAVVLVLSLDHPRAAQVSRRSVNEDQKRRLTVTDMIEATHVLHDYGFGPALISPDGKRYLIVLQRGDLARNGSWVELLSGGTQSLDAAAAVKTAAMLFSKSTAQANQLITNVRWLDDSKHIAFLWDSGEGSPQVLNIDVTTHQIRELTHHSEVIVKYDISRNGQTIVYMAQERPEPTRMSAFKRNGFAVTDQSIESLLRGHFDGWTPNLHYDTFVSSNSEKSPRKIREPVRKWLIPPELLKVSPDGRYAITVRPGGEVPADWNEYTEHLFKDVYLPAARQHPGGLNAIRQYYLVDTQRALADALWDAPENPYGNVVWAPDSRSLIVGPTFLPPKQADSAALAGSAVVEVDVTTGKYVQLPFPIDLPPYAYRPLHWASNGIVEFNGTQNSDGQYHRLRFKKSYGQWQRITEQEDRAPEFVQIEVRQDPNNPPTVYAVDGASGRERLIKDLNPQLKAEFTLGRVEVVHWAGTDGRPWTGTLYYPVHNAGGHRFPLVIQTHGYLAAEFSLEGLYTTVFAAQPLANRDIAVLQLSGPDGRIEDVMATPREPKVYVAGYEGAVDELKKAGLVDPDKVGIIGFSRTGWHVEYALTHSGFHFAAAEVADNIDGSYLQYLLNENKAEDVADVGAPPFGKGLETWMYAAPAFNADKVYTPLRIEMDSGPSIWIVSYWEMFSNLRYLGKPVELFVIPDIEHGVHILQNPAQRLASQGGTVDWFCFWLKGEEDADPGKGEQYARWQKLRELQRLNERK